MLFFQHLHEIGTSCSSMRTFRSAWESCHEALGFLDPWVAFPALARQTAGLQKQVSVPARPRDGLTIVMLKAILAYMDLHERQSRTSGDNNTADVLLRDAVALIIGFFCDAPTRRAVYEQNAHTWNFADASGFSAWQSRYIICAISEK